MLLYGLNTYGINVTDKQIATPGPYNDFGAHRPAAQPIANPGDAAIQGILHPTTGNWLLLPHRHRRQVRVLRDPASGQYARVASRLMKAAVLGKPIAHSLSPALHRAAYRELGFDDWTYDLVECDEAGLAGYVGGRGPEWAA